MEQEAHRVNHILGAEELEKLLKKSYNLRLRKKHSPRQRKEAYWWSEEIASMRKRCTEAKKDVTRANKRPNINLEEKNRIQNQYRERRNTLKKTIRKAKKVAWDSLCKEIDVDLWGMGFKIATGKLGAKSAGTISDEMQLQIAKELFPEHKKIKWTRIPVNEDDIPECTIMEIREAGQKIKTGKAAGPDGIPPEVIKAVALRKPEIIQELIDSLIKNGIFPNAWKICRLTLIEKPMRRNKVI